MNTSKPTTRVRTIKIRSTNHAGKKSSLLLSHHNPQPEIQSTRHSQFSDQKSPKYFQFTRRSADNQVTEKEYLNNSTANPLSKLNNNSNRPAYSSQITPNTHSSYSNITESSGASEESKGSRLSKRNSITRERKPSTANEPDMMFCAQNLPLKPAAVFKLFSSYLSKYEQSEILDFKEIYYIGMTAPKAKTDHAFDNFGFDDDRNDYKLVIGDHIAYRYEIQQILGKGSFGQVCKCYDHKKKKQVAVKVIRNQKRFHRQAKVEINILQELKEGESQNESYSVQMLEYFLFRKHICITFELLSINLYDLLKSNSFKGLPLSLVRRFVVQILSCLNYLKQKKVIHCDLKPENILLKEYNKSGIKVIDFGSSCFDYDRIYTYIQSRFYRAPEIILGIKYTIAIDMWSLGCIAAELHSGYPLFPGESEAEQLLCIMEVKGVPPSDILEISTKKKMFFDAGFPKIVPNSRGKKRLPGTRKLEEKVKTNDGNFLDFIGRCLDWNPVTRITPEEAFMHEFIQEGLRSYNRSVNTSVGLRNND